MVYRLGDLLSEFQEWVSEKRVKKIPYNKWRELKKFEDHTVEIERDDWAGFDLYSLTGKAYLIDTFWEDDDSFGTYLKWRSYLDEPISLNLNSSSMSDALAKCASAATNVAKAYSDLTVSSVIDNIAEKTAKLEVREDALLIDGKTIEEIIDDAIGNSISIRKENNNMNLFKNFDFGSCSNDNVKMSVYGIAVKNAAGAWVSYDAATGNIVDVDILNFDAKYLYKMPVAIKDVAAGDTVIHNRKPMFVTKVESGKILAIDPAAGEEKIILLTKSMFGFDFVTKVVNLFSNFMGGATADAPFGNMLPLMLMSEGKNDDMLPLMFLMNGGKMDMSNPMMLYFLMKDNKNSNDLLPFMLFADGTCKAHGEIETCDRAN